jgi:hypothetical protein
VLQIVFRMCVISESPGSADSNAGSLPTSLQFYFSNWDLANESYFFSTVHTVAQTGEKHA